MDNEQTENTEPTAEPTSHHRGSTLLAVPQPDATTGNDLIDIDADLQATDFAGAAIVCRNVKAIRYYKADLKRQLLEIQDWCNAEMARCDAAEKYYMGRYADQLRELVQKTTDGIKQKFIRVAGSRVQLKAKPKPKPPEPAIEDATDFANWVMENAPQFVERQIIITLLPETSKANTITNAAFLKDIVGWQFTTVHQVNIDDKAALAHVKATGEMADGVKWPEPLAVIDEQDEVYIQ